MAAGRRIDDEVEARRCVFAAKRAGQTAGEWARAHGIDGRSLHAWKINFERGEAPLARRAKPHPGASALVETLPRFERRARLSLRPSLRRRRDFSSHPPRLSRPNGGSGRLCGRPVTDGIPNCLPFEAERLPTELWRRKAPAGDRWPMGYDTKHACAPTGGPWHDHLVPARKELKSAITYIDNQKALGRMADVEAQTRNYPIGTGVTEAAAETIVGVRMKRAGARFSQHGGQTVMTFRAALLSHRFDALHDVLRATYTKRVRPAA